MSTSPADQPIGQPRQPPPGERQADAPTAPTAPTAPSAGRRVGAAIGRTAAAAAHGTRNTIRRNPTADKVYRTSVGVVGGGTVALGVVLMPLPGPGALIALGGLGILATEFDGAKKVSSKANAAAKKAYDAAKAARARRKEAAAAAESAAAAADSADA
jgi:uncharacterized protein (TIGR02611 family)